MAVKNRGISPDLLIHPGETISDLLEERGITQKELAQRAGVSEAFLSDVIHGKKDISKGLAMGLEYAFGVPGSFWLNLQANYDAELLSLQEEESVEEAEKEVLASINKYFSVAYDETGSIGKRYRRQDAIGTPYCITVDFDTIEKDNCVTVRDRDSMEQVRLPISELKNYLQEKLDND